ncbi:MAG: T9SS type A sorting domain-containing protein [Bacteroidia bacterium]|nr:T9SS type A sorting domain-containing protein [Bacteroidia bacterium]
MTYSLRLCILFLLLSLSGVNFVLGSHVMGGDLTYQHLGGNQYRIKLTEYRDCSGITPSAFASVSVSSASCVQSYSLVVNLEPGYPIEVSAICPAQIVNTTCGTGSASLPGVQEYVYSSVTTLPMACSDWVFSWYDCCRNGAITTITNPSFAGIYLEATLNNLTVAGNSSPDFTTKPVPYFGMNQAQTYSHATVEIDGDVLVYSLVSPFDNAGVPVTFNAPYSSAYPLSTSTGTFPFNPVTGQMTFTPNMIQNAVMAVKVEEYRAGVLIGSVMRDIQMVILNASNGSSTVAPLSGISGASLVPGQANVFSACVGTPMSFQVTASDPNPATIITHTSTNVTSIPGSVLTGTGNNPKVLTFNWTPTPASIGTNSFSISFTDGNCPIPSLISMNIVIYVLGIDITTTDTAICTLGSSVQLNTNIVGASGGIYAWTGQGLSASNIANPVVTPTSVPSTYTVSYDIAGCNATDEIQIIQGATTVNAFTSDSVICAPKPIQLNATVNGTSGGTYSWAGNGLSATNIANPVATPGSFPQTYTLTYTTPGGGCIATDVTTVVQSTILATAAVSTPSAMCLGGGPVQLTASPNTPLASGYDVTSIPYAPIAGSGTTVTLGDDQVSGVLPIGFNFTFYGNTYSDFYISSNGFITFNPASGSGCCSGQVLPNASDPNDLIAANWDDLYPPAGGSIEYFTTGIAPNRILVVNYIMINPCCGVNAALDATAQILLYEGTNIIEIHAADIGGSGGQTMGIENSNGTLATVVPGRNSTTWTATNEGWRFSLTTSYTYSWSPSTNLSAVNIYNPVISALIDTVYTVTITSTEGCTGSSTVVINTDNTLSNIATAIATPDSICSGSATPVQLNASPVSIVSYNGNGPYSVMSIPFSPVAGSGTPVILGDDQVSGALPVGFNFTFYGNTYSNFYISSNGFITFNPASGSGCCSGQVVPNVSDPNDLIAANWDDLYPPAGGSIEYFTTGIAPNRILVVNYTMINPCCGVNALLDATAQILLYEGTNIIEIHATDIGGSGGQTMGVENSNGTLATVVPGRNSTTWTAINEGWRFVSGVLATHTYLWSPAAGISNTVSHDPVLTPPSSTTIYNVQITEVATGCVTNKPVTLTVLEPVTPDVVQTDYCNSATLSVTNSVTGTINWYTNNTGTGIPVGTGTPFNTTSSNTYYAFENVGGCISGVSNASTVNVGMGNLWTHIPNPPTPLATNQTYYADAYCFDPVSGMNYFYQAGSQTLLMASDYSIPPGVNLVSGTPANATEMAVKLDVLSGYGSGTGTFITAPSAPYVQNPDGWYVMHRTWNVLVHPANQIPSGSNVVRFFFNTIDENDVTTPTGHVLSNFEFYKLITGLDPSLPADHAGVTTPQIQIYLPGGAPTTTTWSLSTDAITGAYYADYAVTSFSGGGGGSGINLPGPLPVELMEFNGENHGSMNLLKWKVKTETNLSHYELQRSGDLYSFAEIGRVPAENLESYHFADNFPLTGNNFYRLKKVDNDGHYTYSHVVQISNYPTGFQYSLYPNPATKSLTLNLQGLNGSELIFRLYNELGQVVLTDYTKETGNALRTMDISSLISGIYFYKLTDGQKTYSGKIIKE